MVVSKILAEGYRGVGMDQLLVVLRRRLWSNSRSIGRWASITYWCGTSLEIASR
jgi:hypothetical protein